MAWLATLNRPGLPAAPVPLEWMQPLAAWRLLGGVLDWAGLSRVAALLGIRDEDELILDLATLRDAIHKR